MITLDGEITATGRNRLAEHDPGEDVLAGSSLAHAEMNALAKLRWGASPPGLQLWTTLQPCLQCLGAIRLSPVRHVHALAPDPLFRGVERARELNEFIGRDWPTFIELEVDEWSAFSLLLQTHVTTFWGVAVPGWNEALPSVKALAVDLVESGRLVELAAAGATVDDVGEELSARLAGCVSEIAALSAT